MHFEIPTEREKKTYKKRVRIDKRKGNKQRLKLHFTKI